MKNRAFTLIELLVVVLILGILVAIALPQYQVAVAKADVAKIISLVKVIAEQQRAYYLAHSRFADNLEDLDITVNAPDDWWCHLYKGSSETGDNNAVECAKPVDNPTLAVVYYYGERTNTREMENKLYCWADGTFARRVCSTFGPLLNYYRTQYRYLIQ